MRKFKYLSGDFVSSYNRAISDLKREQRELDEKYSEMINTLVKTETARLEQVIPKNFKIGEKVKDTAGNVGTVVGNPVHFEVNEDEDYHGPKFGPGKYFPVENESDETVVTCEGLLRMIDVEIDGSEIEKDWMIDKKTVRYYSDELTIVRD